MRGLPSQNSTGTNRLIWSKFSRRQQTTATLRKNNIHYSAKIEKTGYIKVHNR